MRIRINGESLRRHSDKVRGAVQTAFGPNGRSARSVLVSPAGMVVLAALILLAGAAVIWVSHSRAQREFGALSERFDQTLRELVTARQSWLPSGYDVSEAVLDYGSVSGYVLAFETAIPSLEADRRMLMDGSGVLPWFAGARERRGAEMLALMEDEEGIARRAYYALRSLDDVRYEVDQSLAASREVRETIAGTLTVEDGPAELRDFADRLDVPEQGLEGEIGELVGPPPESATKLLISQMTVPGRDVRVTAIRAALVSGLGFRLDQELRELGDNRDSLREVAEEMEVALSEVGERASGSSDLTVGLQSLNGHLRQIQDSLARRTDQFMAGMGTVAFMSAEVPVLEDARAVGTSLVESRVQATGLRTLLELLDTSVEEFRVTSSAESFMALAERSRQVLAFDGVFFTTMTARVDMARSIVETLDREAEEARANSVLWNVLREQAEGLRSLLDEAQQSYSEAGEAFDVVSEELSYISTQSDVQVARVEDLRTELQTDLKPLAPQVAGFSERFGEERLSFTEPALLANLEKSGPPNAVELTEEDPSSGAAEVEERATRQPPQPPAVPEPEDCSPADALAQRC